MDSAGVRSGNGREDSSAEKKEQGLLQGLLDMFRRKERERVDIPFLLIVAALVVIGLIMLLSASYPYARYYRDNSYVFFTSQLLFAVFGIAAAFLMSRFDYHHWHRLAIPLMVVAFVLLVLVLFAGGDNKRLISLGFTTFQPSEIAKFALIVFLADYISRHFKNMRSVLIGFLPPILVLGGIVALLMQQPHLSCSVIVTLITISMLYIGGINGKLLIFGGVAIAGILLCLVMFTDIVTYAQDRLKYWIDPFQDIQGDGWQTVQSLYAIGSGGLFGQGLGNSRQKHLYLPEPQNDFIFAIVCEELGFVGAIVVVALFALLVWRGFVIASRSNHRFGRILGIGLTIQVGLQALLNIGVVTGTLPNTGISLPFFSSGGTSLVMLLMQMGIILSISRTSRIEKAT